LTSVDQAARGSTSRPMRAPTSALAVVLDDLDIFHTKQIRC
jgi:hypothetical protein